MNSTRQNHAYNYQFKCLLEGIEVKFISASITCAPMGNEATVNLHSTDKAFDLKPKTAIHIFYLEWWKPKAQWKVLFEGFVSRYDKNDQTQGGAGIAATCRDFRMDIRKAPAAVVFGGRTTAEMLNTMNQFNSGGINGGISISGVNAKAAIRVFDYTNLADLFFIVRLIAGTSQNFSSTEAGETTSNANSETDAIVANAGSANVTNTGASSEQAIKDQAANKAKAEAEEKAAKDALKNPNKTDAERAAKIEADKYSSQISDISEAMKQVNANLGKQFDESGNECRWFLDAFIKGLWYEAVGGTAMSGFLNKRIRADKRIASIANMAGYTMFTSQSITDMTGEYLMGNARFTSLEAMIMRLGAMFMTRVYSTSTPPLVDLKDDKARDFYVSEKVYNGLCKQETLFGLPFMSPSTLILPPLEFTAPPNFNVMLPSMYDTVQWQHDDDAEITRGYFTVASTMPTDLAAPGADSFKFEVQVPNTLLNYGGRYLNYLQYNATTVSKDSENKYKAEIKAAPTISLEERYKGVNIMNGSVSDYLARKDVNTNIMPRLLGAEKAMTAQKMIDAIKAIVRKSKSGNAESMAIAGASPSLFSSPKFLELYTQAIKDLEEDVAGVKTKMEAVLELAKKSAAGGKFDMTSVMERHATIKFMNQKFAGRVAQVSMPLNPFPISGLPGAIVADYRGDDANQPTGFRTRKTILGTVQQVNHTIHAQGQAQTSIVMNNCRYSDEPTMINTDGFPTFVQPTVTPSIALSSGRTGEANPEIDTKTMEYRLEMDKKGTYYVGPDKSQYKYKRNKDINLVNGMDFSLEINDQNKDFKFAKDFTTVSSEQVAGGQSNLSYMDDVYTPNRVTKFYVDAFGQNPDLSLMVGMDSTALGVPKYYYYDSVHEALNYIETKRPDLMYDYAEAVKFCERNVCNEAGLMCGVMGLAIVNSKGECVRPSTTAEFDIFSTGGSETEYVSMTDKEFDGRQESGETTNGAIQYAISKGYCKSAREYWSDIAEHSPWTPFIRQRREAVEEYKASIDANARGVRYAYDQ